MGVPHDEEADGRVLGEMSLGPRGLCGSGPVEHCGVARRVGQLSAQSIHQPESEIGGQAPESGNGDRAPGDPMHYSRSPVLFGEPVPVNRECIHRSDLEPNAFGPEMDAGVAIPERIAPPVMIAAGHVHGNAARELGERARDPETPAWNGAPPCEPEIEKVAVDEETVAERRHLGEEVEHGFFDARGHGAQVRIADNDQLVH